MPRWESKQQGLAANRILVRSQRHCLVFQNHTSHQSPSLGFSIALTRLIGFTANPFSESCRPPSVKYIIDRTSTTAQGVRNEHPRNSVAYTERVNVKIDMVLFAYAFWAGSSRTSQPQYDLYLSPAIQTRGRLWLLTSYNLEKL